MEKGMKLFELPNELMFIQKHAFKRMDLFPVLQPQLCNTTMMSNCINLWQYWLCSIIIIYLWVKLLST